MTLDKEMLACQLWNDEGFKPYAYQDSEGFWTIGIGRLIDKRKGGGITKSEALYLLNNDIESHSKELYAALPWLSEAPQEVQQVLMNMAFNLGVPGLLAFKHTLALMQAGKYREAADEMFNSKWAKQIGDGPGGKDDRAERLSDRIKALEP